MLKEDLIRLSELLEDFQNSIHRGFENDEAQVENGYKTHYIEIDEQEQFNIDNVRITLEEILDSINER